MLIAPRSLNEDKPVVLARQYDLGGEVSMRSLHELDAAFQQSGHQVTRKA